MGITVPTIPPLRLDQDAGYLEIIEGPIGPVDSPIGTSTNPSGTGSWLGSLSTSSSYVLPTSYDTTMGDPDDISMFTARAIDEDFVGRYNNSGTFSSSLAEIAWFMRKGTLYRRVLLIKPSLGPSVTYNYEILRPVDPRSRRPV